MTPTFSIVALADLREKQSLKCLIEITIKTAHRQRLILRRRSITIMMATLVQPENLSSVLNPVPSYFGGDIWTTSVRIHLICPSQNGKSV